MKAKENVTAARILTAALLFSIAVLAYTVHREYSEEISDHIEKTVVELLPDMENSLAKL
ncbi:hypothetical protein [Allomuricauda sp. d1]|uniref:hypothetical protein n=1 Tax=Allomuricauda sp. d1 TaxID=3136725 RepID=UPI0031CF9E2E